VLIQLTYLSFRTYGLNDSAYIGSALLYCCVLLITDENDDDAYGPVYWETVYLPCSVPAVFYMYYPLCIISYHIIRIFKVA